MSFARSGRWEGSKAFPTPAQVAVKAPDSVRERAKERSRAKRQKRSHRVVQRAIELIKEHAGENSLEAQRTRWLVALVKALEKETRGKVLDLQVQCGNLEKKEEALQGESAQLKETVSALEARLSERSTAVQHLEEELAESKQKLGGAAEAVQRAEQDAASLQQVVDDIAKSGGKVRQGLAVRTHDLREALLQTRRRWREQQQTVVYQEALLRNMLVEQTIKLQCEKENGVALALA